MTDAICSIDGCDRRAKARGWCAMHHNRWLRSGDTGAVGPDRPTVWDRIDKGGAGGCWLWTGQIEHKGYGRWAHRRAHRVVYELVVGPIPDELQIDHLCRVRRCVNPDHLEPVTLRENLARSTNLAAIGILFNTCARGHEFTPENTYIRPSRPRSRDCRQCIRERQAGARRTA